MGQKRHVIIRMVQNYDPTFLNAVICDWLSYGSQNICGQKLLAHICTPSI